MSMSAIPTVQVCGKKYFYLSDSNLYLRKNKFTWDEWQEVLRHFMNIRAPDWYFEIANASAKLDHQKDLLYTRYYFPCQKDIAIYSTQSTKEIYIVGTHNSIFLKLGIWLRKFTPTIANNLGMIPTLLRYIDLDLHTTYASHSYDLNTLSYRGALTSVSHDTILSKTDAIKIIKRLIKLLPANHEYYSVLENILAGYLKESN